VPFLYTRQANIRCKKGAPQRDGKVAQEKGKREREEEIKGNKGRGRSWLARVIVIVMEKNNSCSAKAICISFPFAQNGKRASGSGMYLLSLGQDTALKMGSPIIFYSRSDPS